ncbi:MAG: trigger factor [Bacillota bacterium]|nr:trigger factor [Bacillota bacterium]
MKAIVETVETNKVRLDIEVEADEFSKAVDQAYRKLVKTTSIPGFRKGKAPRHIFERRYGKSVLYDEAFESLFPTVYARAVEETGIAPVDQPDVDVEQMEDGKPLVLKAQVTVKPEVTLGEYTTIGAPRGTAEVAMDEVDFQVEMLRERQAQLVPVEAPVEKGHFLTMDFEGSVGGEKFPGGAAQGYTLEVGSGRFIPGFEDQLLGMTKDETKDVNTTFPADYTVENLAGKEAVFKTTVKEIKKKELPEVNDEFAKSVASKDSVEELRKDIENRLLESKEQQIKRQHENEVVQRAVDMSTVEIPPVMIDRRADEMFKDLLERLEARKLTLDEYLRVTDQKLDDVRKEMKDAAGRNVKTDLVIEAIGKKENIEASQEEVDSAISNMSAAYRQKPEIIKSLLMNQGGIERLKDGIISDKTIALLTSRAIENAAHEGQAAEGGATVEEATETAKGATADSGEAQATAVSEETLAEPAGEEKTASAKQPRSRRKTKPEQE